MDLTGQDASGTYGLHVRPPDRAEPRGKVNDNAHSSKEWTV